MVLRSTGMPLVLATAAMGFSGFSLLLPISPLWAVEGGADEFGAGLATTVLMAFTVLTQLQVNRWLARFGWTAVVAVGLLALGVPAALQALSPELWLILVTQALRGVGFGILTVCGSTAVALLVPPEMRGRGIGLYGLSAALPQLGLMTLSPLLADWLGIRATLVLGLVPVLGLLWVSKLGRVVEERGGRSLVEAKGGGVGVLARIWVPIIALLLVTASGGAVLTFAPQLVESTGVAMLVLFAVTAVAAVGRYAVGPLCDRFGTGPFVWSLLLIAALGVVGVALALGVGGFAWLIIGAGVLGLSYGALQTVTLVRAYADAGEENRPGASVAWNVGFDVGTGLGAMAIGALAQGWSFGTAFWATAAACAVAALLVGVVDLVRSPRPSAAARG
ncbi:MAG TPA: MFS transporter [Tessaracoccus flavescens]|uniref:MFS transporter n=1 Tax=Tessaracoccus flavescens TaxID=399497 RepID=A0A921JQS0_9ACTN|nr:MFS transporter [Tessaracoccus flavescens]